MIKKFFFTITTIFIVLIFVAYSLEFFLALWNHSSIKKDKFTSQEMSRYSIYLKEKKTNQNVVLTIAPTTFLNEKNTKIFPMAGLPNALTINCNELGFWSRYNSDKFGFNNPNDEWEKKKYKYLLIGDSYLHGDCVNFPDDIGSQLRTNLQKNLSEQDKGVLNLAYQGNGPLIQNAVLREYFPDEKVENILIFFANANDIQDFFNEIKHPILRKYLDDKNFSQNLKMKPTLIKKILKEKFQKEIERETDDRLVRFNEISIKRMLTFSNLKHRLIWQFGIVLFDEKHHVSFEINNKDLLIKNFIQIKEFSEMAGSNLYFVFIPSYPVIDEGSEILNLIEELNIPIINLKKEVFDKHPDKLSLFPFRAPGHYTPEGYKLITEKIIELIN